MMKVLVIDNYDSFTYNIVQYLGEFGIEAEVWRNDQFEIEDIDKLQPDRIIISPGPCTPSEAGLSIPVIEKYAPQIPILGVCLGHQSMGQAFGGNVMRAKHIMHGKMSRIQHNEKGVFAGIPEDIQVTRYHSLVVEDLPEVLEATAWTTEVDGSKTLMALRHKQYPMHGVQFHPESIASEHGHQMLKNFLDDPY
ncbi:anthranilate synthase component II [Deinococcus cellulosilyticus]|uniref:Anthranilate synthase component 2 n=1 Tax=Deinococcus cellulosilyticus (strain DSM 18568 / NBRC 106333 / KACC 11606 / 5516J-15) TaxID=1223518 RepID=A0A511N536_DEIC1|nr:aminodeoxychorismate/anthranilate synthase component II [Deinococcus cellulosilyticus]GEM47566.1 anthranilate synthase component 2 [Deinococcus cellulosilyticus NBRC 106333 = KACC 11606]